MFLDLNQSWKGISPCVGCRPSIIYFVLSFWVHSSPLMCGGAISLKSYTVSILGWVVVHRHPIFCRVATFGAIWSTLFAFVYRLKIRETHKLFYKICLDGMHFIEMCVLRVIKFKNNYICNYRLGHDFDIFFCTILKKI